TVGRSRRASHGYGQPMPGSRSAADAQRPGLVSDKADGKQCGECSLCCKVMGIPELGKPKDASCAHIVAHKGCAIYGERPPSCLTQRLILGFWGPTPG